MTSQKRPSEDRVPAETSIEWGVRWNGGFYTPPPLPFASTEAAMREFAAGIAPADEPEVQCRTVIRTPWHRPDGGWQDGAVPMPENEVAITRRVEPYRFGSHNPRNIYRTGVDRDTDEQVGVMFTPEMGRLVVIALNALAGGPDA